jgi:hypothetical protein
MRMPQAGGLGNRSKRFEGDRHAPFDTPLNGCIAAFAGRLGSKAIFLILAIVFLGIVEDSRRIVDAVADAHYINADATVVRGCCHACSP